jgi:hypothetical protein
MGSKISEVINSADDTTEAMLQLAKLHEAITPLVDSLEELVDTVGELMDETAAVLAEAQDV